MAKVPLNHCSFEDLLAIPGATPGHIGYLWALRGQCGEVTQELFEASSHYEEVKDLQGSLDFRPREAVGDFPIRPGGFRPLSETGDVGSTPAETPGEIGDEERGAPVYPHDRYPPPHGAEEARPRPAARTENKGGDAQLWGEGDSTQPREFGNRHNSGWSNAPRSAYQDLPSGPAPEERGFYRSGGGKHYRRPHVEPQRNREEVISRPPVYTQAWERGKGSYQPMPKSVVFDGRGNWRAFFRKFSAFADAREWDHPQRLNQLCWCLDGSASDFFDMTQERDPGVGYFGMVRHLEGRFGYREPPEAVLLEFNTAKQGADEPLLEWADRLHRLASRAFPEVPEAYVQRQTVLRMCQGCVDKDAGYQALNQRPSTVEEAVEAIRWLQHAHGAMYGRGSRANAEMRKSDKGTRGPEIREVEITPRTTDARLSGLELRISELEGHVSGLVRSLGKLMAAQGGTQASVKTTPSGKRNLFLETPEDNFGGSDD